MLRDPQGVEHYFSHFDSDAYKVYFSRDPTIYQTCHKAIILPVGSIPGTWGLAQMVVHDKAHNILRADFTEIIRFEETGEGALLVESATTDSSGQAESTLTLGSQPGTNTVEVIVALKPVTFTVFTAQATPDFDGNGVVGFADFLQFAQQFGLSQSDTGYDARYDLDGDGTTGFGDFMIFANAFGKETSSN